MRFTTIRVSDLLTMFGTVFHQQGEIDDLKDLLLRAGRALTALNEMLLEKQQTINALRQAHRADIDQIDGLMTLVESKQWQINELFKDNSRLEHEVARLRAANSRLDQTNIEQTTRLSNILDALDEMGLSDFVGRMVMRKLGQHVEQEFASTPLFIQS
jgi:chromosome segregation ATPase